MLLARFQEGKLMILDKIFSYLFNIPKFGGDIWYVATGSGSDNNDGKRPARAKATIGAAIISSSAGDAINAKAGTYSENGLNLAADGLELWGEIGVIITNGAGTCLTVSGDYCRVRGVKVKQAGQVGFAITGIGCVIEDCIAEDCTIAYDIDGAENVLLRCEAINATTIGYDIATEENTLYLCNSIGTGTDTSRGFYLSHTNAHENLLEQCLSLGNDTAGYATLAGADNNVFAYCTSGGKDGARADAGARNTWPEFQYEGDLHTVLTFGGSGPTSVNLFRVYGIIDITFIYGVVKTNLNADVDNISLDVFPDGGPLVPLTTLVDSASAVVGSLFLKASEAANPLVLQSAATPFIQESTNKKEPFVTTIIGEEGDGTETYIRCTYSGTGTSGAIDWYIHYDPLSDNGYVSIV